MNSDFRVAVGFTRHPKTIRFRKLVGPDAVSRILELWEFTALHRPEGKLDGLSPAEIGASCGWGKRSELVWNSLLSAGFLDSCSNGSVSVHAWEEHNGYAVHSKERSERARQMAAARWSKPMPQAMPTAMLQAMPIVDAPSPSPSPVPSPSPSEVGEVSPTTPLFESVAPIPSTAPVRVPKNPRKRKAGVSPLSLPPERLHQLESWFDWLYDLYPRHVARPAAWRAFLKLEAELDRALVGKMAENAKRRVERGEWTPDDPERRRFILHLSTFLNQRRWEDET